MKLHVGFHCWGLGIGLGLHLAVGTDEKGGKGFVEGKEVRNRK
jgi:hypothetical protein